MAERVCPWYIGYLLINPLRKLIQNPEKILTPYIKEGMTVLEIGPGMGFFSLPLAKLVGKTGKIIAVDLQEKMIKSLIKRAKKSGLSERIEARVCTKESLGIEDKKESADFALAFAVVHEIPDRERLFLEISKALQPKGKLLIVEPPKHVSQDEFNKTISLAQKGGFDIIETPQIKRSLAVLLSKR